MPKINTTYQQPYDFKAWRARCGIATQDQAATSLGLSYSTYCRMEATGVANRDKLWACYGIEQYIKNKPAPVQMPALETETPA